VNNCYTELVHWNSSLHSDFNNLQLTAMQVCRKVINSGNETVGLQVIIILPVIPFVSPALCVQCYSGP